MYLLVNNLQTQEFYVRVFIGTNFYNHIILEHHQKEKKTLVKVKVTHHR